MRYTFLFFILSLSCNKSTTNLDLNSCKLQSITYDFSPSPRTYQVIYLGENISELTSSVNRIQFTYNSNNQLIKKETFNANSTVGQYKTEYTYDASSNLIQELDFEIINGTYQATAKYTYQYVSGKRSQKNLFSNGGVTYNGKLTYEWMADNIVSVTGYDRLNVFECKVLLTHDLSKDNSFKYFKNMFLQDVYDEDFPEIFYLCKNPITSIRSQCPTLEVDTWNYNYNSNGFIKTVDILNNGAPSQTSYWRFAYTCD